MVTTRWATPHDVPWLLGQLRDFAAFYGSKHNLFPSEEYARENMTNLILNHVVFVAERDGELVGFIAGMMLPHPMNPDIKTLSEYFWWVPEQHRHTRAGLLLFNEFMRFGKERADWIVFTLEHNSPVKGEHLIARGFKVSEVSYLMEV